MIKQQFECTFYLENVSKRFCWDITSSLRKRMYELIMKRNNQNGKKIEFPMNIEEIRRRNFESISVSTSIDPSMNENSNDSIDNNFIIYLNLFQSNVDKIKSLPYYLEPLSSSLRYFLQQKSSNKLFVYESNDPFYRHLPKAVDSEDSNVKLHSYEFEAILATCVATLAYYGYLSTSSCLSNNTLPYPTIRQNIDDNKLPFSNVYLAVINNKDRGLTLRNNANIKNLQRNREQFKNAVHIYAEFTNVLIMNSYLLQTLKLNQDIPEFSPFFSMYSYVWEAAYYSLVDHLRDFKVSKNKRISFIFNQLFDINDSNTEAYLKYLDSVYSRMLDAIVN